MNTSKLDNRFKQVGLNADWWCCTWQVTENIFICDNEDIDETFSVGKRYESDDENDDDDALFTGSIDEVLVFVDNMIKNEIVCKVFLPIKE